MKEIRQTARERMKGYCRVCPVCDGRACAGEVPGMGGRPFSVAAIGGLTEGVEKYIEQIQSELVSAMVLTGTQSVGSVEKTVLYELS
jgi:hypothetical protein